MPRPAVTIRLRDKLGHDAAEDLAAAFEEAKVDMLTATHERFESRLQVVAAELRQDMARLEGTLRAAMADLRADIVRWSFLFWIGQAVTIISVIAYMLRSVAR